MENLDPNALPGDAVADGQPANAPEPTPEPSPAPDPTEERLAKLEEQNKNLQHRLTQDGRKRAAAQQAEPAAPAPAEDFDWNNPGESIGKYVGSALNEFEARQNQRREAEDLIRRTAEERGIPVPKLQEYYQKLQEASADPYELMDTVARMYQADNAQEAISQATNATKQTLERNARGVTSEGGPTQPGQEVKPHAEMSDEELDAHVKSTFGVADWNG